MRGVAAAAAAAATALPSAPALCALARRNVRHKVCQCVPLHQLVEADLLRLDVHDRGAVAWFVGCHARGSRSFENTIAAGRCSVRTLA